MSGQKPKVSIGLPIYNGARCLVEALDTILAQTFEDWALIISDNASTDETARICRAYEARDARIRYVRNARNVGANRNHNMAFRLASGRYFKWAAADDAWGPSFLARCVQALDTNPSAVLAYPQPDFINADGKPVVACEHAFRHSAWSSEPTLRFR